MHPLFTTFLLLQPASTCTILPSSGKTVTEKEKIHMKNDAVYRSKSEQDTAFEELYRNDKDIIHLPRQDYGISDRMNWNGDRVGNYLTLIMV